MSILFFLTIIGIIVGLLFQKNKVVTTYNAVLMWIITGWQYNTADYYEYGRLLSVSASNFSLSIFKEPFFYLINVVVNRFNGNIQAVYIICGLMAVVVLIWGISRLTDRINLVLSFFLIATFLLYAVQIRNFVAMAFILVAMKYIVDEKKNVKKFVLFILIASGFHVTALFYLIFIPIPYLTKLKVALLTLLLCIGAYFSENLLSSTLLSLGRIDYTVSSHSSFTIAVYNIYVLAIILFVIIICQVIERKSDYYSDIEGGYTTQHMAQAAEKIAIMMLVCIPLQSVTIECVRLCRNLLPFFFCVIARLYPQEYRVLNRLEHFSFDTIIGTFRALNRLERFSFCAIIGTLMYCLIYGDLYIYRQCYETVFLALFENNLLLG